MRALVTGAAGFVGSHLAEALLTRGDTVVGVDCFTPYYDRADKEQNLASARAHDRFEFVEADLRTYDDRARCSSGVDAVFHQAAQAGVRLSWSDGFADYVGHNVLATQRLLEAVQRARPAARVVYASSSSVYGNQPRYPDGRDRPAQAVQPVRRHQARGRAPLRPLRRELGRAHGVAAVLHRVRSAPTARHVDPPPVPGRGRRLDVSRCYGDGTQIREFTYVDDIVAGNLAAAEPTSRPAPT